jgi:hypothetical protein
MVLSSTKFSPPFPDSTITCGLDINTINLVLERQRHPAPLDFLAGKISHHNFAFQQLHREGGIQSGNGTDQGLRKNIGHAQDPPRRASGPPRRASVILGINTALRIGDLLRLTFGGALQEKGKAMAAMAQRKTPKTTRGALK